jgi:hypothetical protein
MSTDGTVLVRVSALADSDSEELAELTLRLRAELLQFEIDAVDPVVPEAVYSERDLTKGIPGLAAVGHWLAVQLGVLSIGTVLAGVADWVARNNRTVEIAYGDQTLKLSRATPEQQEKLINAWVASLPPGT